MWSRRTFLSAVALSALPRLSRAATRPSATRPRYFCNILLNGGIDPIYTLDPKSRADVASWVDVPYSGNDILTLGDLPMGPHFKPFADAALPIAVLRGVGLLTGNHHTGHAQHVRLRTNVSPTMPTLFDVIGRHRDGQPLGAISFGPSESLFSPGWFGGDILSRLDDTPAPTLQAMANALRAEARDLRGATLPAEAAATAANLESCADLFDRLPKVPPFRADPDWPSNSERYQRALWAFEHDLTACIYITARGDWDTHMLNGSGQESASRENLPPVARFLSELSRRRNRFGSLADNAVVMVGSEIGRLPRLNELGGKDHFPEAPFLLFGRSINTNGARGAVYGRTGPRMDALPVSLRTGQPADAGHRVLLDDVGATLLHLAGIDPAPYGYDGRILEFLLA